MHERKEVMFHTKPRHRSLFLQYTLIKSAGFPSCFHLFAFWVWKEGGEAGGGLLLFVCIADIAFLRTASSVWQAGGYLPGQPQHHHQPKLLQGGRGYMIADARNNFDPPGNHCGEGWEGPIPWV